ncbi:hypothetical protein [Bacillus toyonensis]|nr:hypothetical protein [Bacillus toyonensis]
MIQIGSKKYYFNPQKGNNQGQMETGWLENPKKEGEWYYMG